MHFQIIYYNQNTAHPKWGYCKINPIFMKRILFLLLALVGLIFTAQAYDFSATAPSGQTLYYMFIGSNKVSVIHQNERYPYYSTYPTGDLIIPSSVQYDGTTYSVTHVGASAFHNCTELTSVTIPNTVTIIGVGAFLGCTSLTSVTIPNTVTSISTRVFYGCTSLTSVTIPNTVTQIYENAFYDCTGITSLTIPNSVTTINNNAFAHVNNIVYSGTATGSPWGAKTINGYFEGDFIYTDNTKTTLTGYVGTASAIVIPSTVTTIGSYAFYNCTGLTSIGCTTTNPPAVGDNAFDGVPTDIPVYVPCGRVATYQPANGWNQFTNIQENLSCSHTITATTNNDAWGTINGGGSYTIGTTVTLTATPNCGYRFVQWDDGIIDNPRTVTVTGDATYTAEFEVMSTTGIEQTCSSGQTLVYSIDCATNTATVTGYSGTCPGDLVIPASITVGGYTFDVKTIESFAFSDCSNLTSVSIPNSVSSIGFNVFNNCCRLSSIIVEDGNNVYDSREGCNAIIRTSSNVLIAGCKNTVVPNTISAIEDYAFNNCQNDIYCMVQVPPSINSYFFDEFNPRMIYIPCGAKGAYQAADGWSNYQNYQEIAGRHVQNCSSGQSLVYILNCDNTVSVVGYEGECSGTLHIPSSIMVNGVSYTVTRISDNAFGGNTDITNLTLPPTITYIGSGAFAGCTSLASVNFTNYYNNALDTIGETAFLWCGALTSFDFSKCDHLRYIGHQAFFYCNLTSIYLPESLQNIDEDYPDTYERMNPFCCQSLTNINGVENEYYRYVNNTIINKARNEVVAAGITATVPTGVTAIRAVAYAYSTIRKIIIPEGVTTLGRYLFAFSTVDSVIVPSTIRTTDCSFDYTSTIKYIEYVEGILNIPVLSLGNARSVGYYVNIEKIVIPSTVTSIGHIVVIDDSNLDSIVCKALTPPIFTDQIGLSPSFIISVPCRSVETYRAADQWRDNNIIGYDCETIKTISLVANDDAMGTLTGAGSYANGETATLTASPNCGYRFVQWSDGNTDNPRIVTVTSDTTFTAEFSDQIQVATTSGQTLVYSLNCSNNTATITGYIGTCSGDLVIPASITVGGYTFDVTSIGNQVFWRCTGLTSVSFGSTLTSIGNGAFWGCNMTAVYYTGTLAQWCGIDFYDINTGANSNPLRSAHNLYIGGTLLTDLVIPSEVTEIKSHTFIECTSITTLTIPNTVTSIGYGAFELCTGLTYIKSQSTTPPATVRGAFNDIPTDVPIIVPCGSVAAYQGYECLPGGLASYQGSQCWNHFTNYQEEANCTHTIATTSNNDNWGTVSGGGNNIEFGSSITLTAIPNCGYRFVQWNDGNTDNLRTVTVTEDVSYIAEFSNQIQVATTSGQTLVYSVNCSNNTATVTGYIGTCSGDLVIPASITVDGYTFDVTAIGSNAFQNCSGITSVTIPTSITNVGINAFVRCYNIVVNYQGDIAQWCTLIDYDVWANPTYYASSLIINGTPVTNLTIPEGVTEIKPMAFDAYNGLLSVVIPNTVTTIGSNAFYRCHYLTNVTIGSSVNFIDSYAFYECERLTSITILAHDPPELGTTVFVEALRNATLYVPCGRVEAYRAADGWGQFANIQENPGCSVLGSGISINIDGNAIVVSGAAGNTVTLFDNTYSVIATSTAPAETPLRFENLASGAYFVKVGTLPIRLMVEIM